MLTHPLYLFAPENDMALAFGGKHYTPTPAACQIAKDLSLLPLWYASEDNATVWSKQDISEKMQHRLDALGITAHATKTIPENISHCIPWGWSAYTTERLAGAGIPRDILPDDKTILKIRELSGRATTRLIIQSLHEYHLDYPLPPLPKMLLNDTAVENYINSQPTTMLKSPWSSSGRGVWSVEKGYDKMTAQKAAGIIRKQGYIMGEKLQNKVVDFAMEFYSNGKSVQFAGYSLFETDRQGAYQGNILAADDEIEQQLATYIPLSHLHTTRTALEQILTKLITPCYKGYFGIDMLLYRKNKNNILLHPCIELNLRMNMGMVARTIYNRYIHTRSRGVYRVKYAPETKILTELNDTLTQQYPLKIDNKKITSGYLALTPIETDTHYMAYIIVEN